MRYRKQQKAIDKAIANLMNYADGDAWGERQRQFFDDVFSDAADRLQIATEELVQQLESAGFMHMAFGYLFESFASCCWDNEAHSLIEEYIKRRGWRETPYAKRYLQALGASEVGLWEVISVKPGHFVEVQRLGESEKPLRVHERSGSENLKRWDCIATRVMSLDGTPGFGGSILSFSPEQAQAIPALLQRVCDTTVESLQQIRAEETDVNWSDEELCELAQQECDEHFPDLVFTAWVGNVYQSLSRPFPTLLNRDGESLQCSKVTFPINGNNERAIRSQLNAAAYLDYNDANEDWVWLACEADNVPEQGAPLLGHITLSKTRLELTVNSTNRAEQGIAYLQEFLGDLVGQPLTVHESMESLLEQHAEHDPPLAEPIEVPELVTTHLDQHYKQVLDEPVPALNNKTPRECTQGGDRQRLIQWLKGLENHTVAAPQMAHYNFQWIWDELGVEYPK